MSSDEHPAVTFHYIYYLVDRDPVTISYLGGGFKYVLFSPQFGEDSHFDSYFSDGLVQPPTSYEIIPI